jgi:hypothetical protein
VKNVYGEREQGQDSIANLRFGYVRINVLLEIAYDVDSKTCHV